MYAVRRFDVRNWDTTPANRHFSVKVIRGGLPLDVPDCERILVIEENVMIWRYANHIHGWFVDNVQGGVDNCAVYPVSADKLSELRSVCEEVLKASRLVSRTVSVGTAASSENSSPEKLRTSGKVIEDPTVAKQLLPTRSGYVFSSMEYDQSYLDDVRDTHVWVVRMLFDLEDADVPSDIRYSSNW